MRAPTSARSLRITALVVSGLFVVACNQADAIREDALANSTAVTFETADGVTLAGRLFGPDEISAERHLCTHADGNHFGNLY